jgi:hypothetical protein
MTPRKVWRLDAEGRLSPRVGGLKLRVIAAHQGRVDPAADYLFCAPDFLFPIDGLARALRLEVDSRPTPARKATPRGLGGRWAAALGV